MSILRLNRLLVILTAQNKFYDGNTDAVVLTRTLNDVEIGDDVSLTGGTAAFDTKDVGTGKTVTLSGASLSGDDAGNYSLTSVATTTADIKAKIIYVTADVKSKVYGETDPALTYQYTPALIAEDAFSGNLTRVAGEDVDDYAILQGTLSLNTNYTIGYTGANLSITPKDACYNYTGALLAATDGANSSVVTLF